MNAILLIKEALKSKDFCCEKKDSTNWQNHFEDLKNIEDPNINSRVLETLTLLIDSLELGPPHACCASDDLGLTLVWKSLGIPESRYVLSIDALVGGKLEWYLLDLVEYKCSMRG